MAKRPLQRRPLAGKTLPRKPKSLQHLTAKAILPNIITTLALIAGATSIRFALDERWEIAALAIVIAGVLDGMDGSVARMLKSTSRFGAELDSLSDVVSFGVAPGVLFYTWALKDLGGVGWMLALGVMVCCALRLARFNSRLDDDTEPLRKAGFLTGLPAPVAAGLSLLPMMAYLEFGPGFYSDPSAVGLYAAIICLGMVAKFPTYAFRTINIRKDYLVPLLGLVAISAAAVPAYGWRVLIVAGFLYAASIPVSVYRYQQIKKAS